ncbi:MAG: hypothetical protein KJ607_08175, partial [Bacteroidetes bacterium]|nr:hypothetical protein [Bacteroidota bacterium]
DPDYGTYISNVYTSESKRKEWGQAVNQAKINTYDNEETVFMAPDGNTLLLCNSMDNEYSDILIAERKGNMYRYNTKYDYMFKVLNTKTVENGAAISEDCDSYFISGKRDGGFGGSDIYIIRKLPNGEWGQPENLGDNINTEYDEAYPNISPGGNVLYFASKGHNSIGGYDLFMSYWNIPRQEWTEPINLGYPINTTEDNTTISFTGNKRYAYVAARRKEGLGGLDIYRITFQDVEKEYTLMKGSIYLGDSLNATPFSGDNSDLEITVYDEHGNIYGQYLPKNNTGQFVAILPIGEFELSVTYSDGYHEFDDKVEIIGKCGFKKEFDKNIYLKPIN